ncbi:MAG: hypothetical protein IJ661_12255 [Lachnospiraceae bacterium]|nr:hypothetical protein [Lachnospiraceae bacterium]
MKKLAFFTILIVVLAFAVTQMYFRVPAVQEKVAEYTDEEFTTDNTYSDLEELAGRLDEEILKGSESFNVYLKDMDVSEIDNINHLVTGIYGSGDTYQQIGSFGDDYKKVTIKVKRNINYYVLNAYKTGGELPSDIAGARILYGRVKEIIDTCITPGMTDYQKELALHDYLVANCHYSENTDQEADSDIYRAYGAIINGDAVCNGYAEALKLLFDCVDVESQLVVGTADGIDHAWNLVKIGESWYHLDATWDDPLPDKGEVIIHPYFNVSDEVISDNHIWNREDYPKATEMKYNYYVFNGNYFESFDDYKTHAYKEMVSHGNTRYEAVIENFDENDDAMEFLFDGNLRYSSLNWQTFESGKYRVLIMEAN